MRCRACDTPLAENEIIWREDRKTHEELCLRCRRLLFDISEEDLEILEDLDMKPSDLDND